MLVVYVPFVGVAVEGGEKLEALNYVWDTLLFAGAVLLVGRSLGPLSPARCGSPCSRLLAPLACSLPPYSYFTPSGAFTFS